MSQARAAGAGPSRLSKVLAHLNASPKLTLSNLKSLRLTMAFQNDHFGARHFLKEHLPRIRYANPALDIQVERVRKSQSEAWKPELELEFDNGRRQIINLHEKWSTTIVKELMEVAGGGAWQQHKAEALAAGKEVISGEASEKKVPRKTSPALPTLNEFRAARERTATESRATPTALSGAVQPSSEIPIPPVTPSQTEAAASL